MEEGTFMDWLRRDGDAIKEGEPIFTLESDKAAQEIESTDSGVLHISPDAPKPGDVVKVGQLLGYLLAEGETMPLAAAPIVSASRPRVEAAAPISNPIAEPRAKPTMGPIAQETTASPRARRAAREYHVDLAALRPTGMGGRIRERDVLAAAPIFHDTMASEITEPMREVPITALRRTIAERMMTSLRNTAPVTLTCRCDATNLVALRQQLKALGTEIIVPSYNDIVVKLVANALRSQVGQTEYRLSEIFIPIGEARQAADAQREIEIERAGGDDLDVLGGPGITEAHDGALAELPLNLRERCCQCLVFVGFFLCHGSSPQ